MSEPNCPVVPEPIAAFGGLIAAERDDLAAEVARLRQELDEARATLAGVHKAIRGADADQHRFPDGCADLTIEVQELIRERDPARMVMELVHERTAAEAQRDEARAELGALRRARDEAIRLLESDPDPREVRRLVDAARVATPDAEPAPGVPEPQVDESPPETVDLMAALRASLERAKAARAGKAAPGVPAVQIEPFHSGRSWFGNELEAECPCPKETCGLVDLSRAVPECTQHPITRGKTMRQGHPADQCPALPAPGVPVDTEEVRDGE